MEEKRQDIRGLLWQLVKAGRNVVYVLLLLVACQVCQCIYTIGTGLR